MLPLLISVFHVITAAAGAVAGVAAVVAIFHPRGPVQEIRINTNSTLTELRRELAEVHRELAEARRPKDA